MRFLNFFCGFFITSVWAAAVLAQNFDAPSKIQPITAEAPSAEKSPVPPVENPQNNAQNKVQPPKKTPAQETPNAKKEPPSGQPSSPSAPSIAKAPAAQAPVMTASAAKQAAVKEAAAEPIAAPAPSSIQSKDPMTQGISPSVSGTVSVPGVPIVSPESEAGYSSMSHLKMRKHRLSLSGSLIPYFVEGYDQYMSLSVIVDYGYSLGRVEVGPFLGLDLHFDYEKRLWRRSEVGSGEQLIFGLFAELNLVDNTLERSFVPSVGVSAGYSHIDNRHSGTFSGYFAMKFFLAPSSAILVDVKPYWIYARGLRTPRWGVGSNFGLVHYFL